MQTRRNFLKSTIAFTVLSFIPFKGLALKESTEFYTFTTKCKVFQFTVKGAFLKIVPKPEDINIEVLMMKHKMAGYMHNPHGPAVKVYRNGYSENWIDGKKVNS